METIVRRRLQERRQLQEQVVGAPAIIVPPAMQEKGDQLVLSGSITVPKCLASDGPRISISLSYMRLRGWEGKKVSSPAHVIHGYSSGRWSNC